MDYKKSDQVVLKSLESEGTHPLLNFYLFLYEQEVIAVLKFNGNEWTENNQESNDFISTIINFIYLKNIKEIKLDQELLKKDLEIAANMQEFLFPKALFNSEEFSAAGLYLPSFLIGGNNYNVMIINENKVTFCLADISGKGINAAILIANFQAILKFILIREYSLEQAIDMLNYKINEITKGEKFFSLFLGNYNHSDKRLVYACCEHNPLAFCNKSEFGMVRHRNYYFRSR